MALNNFKVEQGIDIPGGLPESSLAPAAQTKLNDTLSVAQFFTVMNALSPVEKANLANILNIQPSSGLFLDGQPVFLDGMGIWVS